MRKVFFFSLLVLFITSCAVQKERQRRVVTFFYDFKKYNKEGFFISPDPYPEKFAPVGMISINIYPATKLLETSTNKSSFNDEYEAEIFVTEDITGEETVKIIVEKAKELGANGLVNFKSTVNYKTYYINNVPREKLDHYEVEGFAIQIPIK